MNVRPATADDFEAVVALLVTDESQCCTFGEFHRRGLNRVSLGVDAENPSGATKLYESVGMATELEQVVYERALA